MPTTAALHWLAPRNVRPTRAAVVYVASWIAGLAVWPSNLMVTASAHDVVHAYALHRVPATAQLLLVEGVAGVALVFLMLALGRATRDSSPGVSSVVRRVGLAACAISLVQCGIGVALATSIASSRHLREAGDLFTAINRLDGVKMVALATVAAMTVVARRALSAPVWLCSLSALASLALVLSGAGYILSDAELADAAAASLPLLLLWALASSALRRGSTPRTGHGQIAGDLNPAHETR